MDVGFCRQALCAYALSQVGSSQRHTVEKWPETGKNQVNCARSSLKKETTSKLSIFVSANKLGDLGCLQSLWTVLNIQAALFHGELKHPQAHCSDHCTPNRVENSAGPCWSKWISQCFPSSFPPAIHQAHLLSTSFSAPSGGSFDTAILSSLPV